jgi:hypothetical protein
MEWIDETLSLAYLNLLLVLATFADLDNFYSDPDLIF